MEFNITLEQFQNAVEIMPMEDSGDLVINATIGSTEGGGDVTYLSQLIQDPLHRTVTDNEKIVWNSKSSFSGNYADLTGIPSSFIPAPHDHNVSDVTNLQENLDSKEGVLLSSQKLRIMLSTGDPTGTDWDIWIKHEA